jgi:putative copper export protein
MRSALLAVHLACAGIWLGVLTEVLFERALLGQGRPQELVLARLHQRVDLWVEVPAFIALLLTGVLMFAGAPSNTLLMFKIGAGVLAIAANAYCVWLVFRRAGAAQRSDWQRFDLLDRTQHPYGAVVLGALLAALATGIYRLL